MGSEGHWAEFGPSALRSVSAFFDVVESDAPEEGLSEGVVGIGSCLEGRARCGLNDAALGAVTWTSKAALI